MKQLTQASSVILAFENELFIWIKESSIPKFEDALKTFEKPDYYDDKLFHEGREFYRKYKGACIFSMALSVVAGHVFENVTKVMVFTKRTETSRRY